MKRWIFNRIDWLTFRSNTYYRFFMKTKDWTLPQLKAYQLEKIRKMGKWWGKDIKTWRDFYSLPITTKEDIFKFTPKQGREYFTHETSGSTGEPRKVYVPRETWYRKMAMFRRSWTLLGRKDEPVLRLIAGEPKFGWYDYWRNVFPLNYRKVCAEHILILVKKKPYLIHGPGGSSRILVEAAAHLGYHDILKNIKVMWLGESSENHKKRILELCKSFHESYGLAELPTVASPCEYSTHVNPETGVVEIIDGEIVVTDFNNDIMPIIRYRTGDSAKIRESDCQCGMEHPIMYDIKGRRSDYYFGPEVRRPIGWWIVSPISHRCLKTVKKWKIEVIPKKRKIILYVIFRDPSAKKEDLEWYRKWCKKETGLDCSIRVRKKAKNWKRELVVVKN